MAVMSVTIIAVKPGRMDDYLDIVRRSEQLLTDCGAKNVRLIVGLAAGEASGSMVTTWEADDFTEYGRVTDGFFSKGGVEIMNENGAADSPILSWQSSTYVDVPH
jgi:hypothetical protein